jgi:cytochrome c peroxidase
MSRSEAEKATLDYRARPLDGIWATAPYLHNGSVPTLAELLTRGVRRRAH